MYVYQVKYVNSNGFVVTERFMGDSFPKSIDIERVISVLKYMPMRGADNYDQD